MSKLLSAQDSHYGELAGTWRLLSFYGEEQATGERSPVFGVSPNGRLILSTDGMMMAVLTAEGRTAPTKDEDRVFSFNSSICYSGRYTIEGGKFITKVDISWNEAWVGTSQARSYRVFGRGLHIVSDWAPSPFEPGKIWRGVLEWEREV